MARKSNVKKSNKKMVKKVQKQVIIEVDEIQEDNVEIQEALNYCKELSEKYKNLQYFVLKDSENYDKLEVQVRTGVKVPFMIRFSRYRMLVKSFFPNSKIDAKKEEDILGFNFIIRDCGNASGGNCTIWYKNVYRPDYNPDYNSFKMWLDYMLNQQNPKPKISMNSNHF